MKEALRTLFGLRRERVLNLVRSIEENGWDEDLARKPLGGVLGYSRSTGRYHAFTGKHRIAALRYLYSKGRIDGATPVRFPVITYPWGAWRQHRPYPGTPLCDVCREDGSNSART